MAIVRIVSKVKKVRVCDENLALLRAEREKCKTDARNDQTQYLQF